MITLIPEDSWNHFLKNVRFKRPEYGQRRQMQMWRWGATLKFEPTFLLRLKSMKMKPPENILLQKSISRQITKIICFIRYMCGVGGRGRVHWILAGHLAAWLPAAHLAGLWRAWHGGSCQRKTVGNLKNPILNVCQHLTSGCSTQVVMTTHSSGHNGGNGQHPSEGGRLEWEYYKFWIKV